MIIVQVPFGKVVRCPSCMIAVAVAQPQQGVQACAYNLDYIVNPSIISAQHILWLLIANQIFREFVKMTLHFQVVSCSKCRYQYELVSGNILTIESEEIR